MTVYLALAADIMFVHPSLGGGYQEDEEVASEGLDVVMVWLAFCLPSNSPQIQIFIQILF